MNLKKKTFFCILFQKLLNLLLPDFNVILLLKHLILKKKNHFFLITDVNKTRISNISVILSIIFRKNKIKSLNGSLLN